MVLHRCRCICAYVCAMVLSPHELLVLGLWHQDYLWLLESPDSHLHFPTMTAWGPPAAGDHSGGRGLLREAAAQCEGLLKKRQVRKGLSISTLPEGLEATKSKSYGGHKAPVRRASWLSSGAGDTLGKEVGENSQQLESSWPGGRRWEWGREGQWWDGQRHMVPAEWSEKEHCCCGGHQGMWWAPGVVLRAGFHGKGPLQRGQGLVGWVLVGMAGCQGWGCHEGWPVMLATSACSQVGEVIVALLPCQHRQLSCERGSGVCVVHLHLSISKAKKCVKFKPFAIPPAYG